MSTIWSELFIKEIRQHTGLWFLFRAEDKMLLDFKIVIILFLSLFFLLNS